MASERPLADKYLSWSPFTYTLNNPVRFIDPDGMQVGVEKEGDQELVRNSVSQEESKYIKFKKNGNIKKGALRRGVKKLGDNASENLTSLNSLVQSKDQYTLVSSDEFGEFDSDLVGKTDSGENESWGPVFEVNGEIAVGHAGQFRPQDGTTENLN